VANEQGNPLTLGKKVRRFMGPLEKPATRAYRSMFVDTNSLADSIAASGPGNAILEIGAGDGTVSGALLNAIPNAILLGIDIDGDPGAMFKGPTSQATFRIQSAEDLLVALGPAFDLVVISDVLHHVPASERVALLKTASELVCEGGLLAIKETCRRRSFRYLLSVFSDRYISGDRSVSFMSEDELTELIDASVEGFEFRARAYIPPSKINVLRMLERQSVAAVIETAIEPLPRDTAIHN